MILAHLEFQLSAHVAYALQLCLSICSLSELIFLIFFIGLN